MDKQKKWEGILIKVMLIVITALVVGGGTWYVMNKKLNETKTKDSNTIKSLQNKITNLENQESLTNTINSVTNTAQQSDDDAQNKANVLEIQTALETYFTDNNAYPATLAAMQTSNPPYLDTSLSLTPYKYTTAQSNTTYTLSFLLENQSDSGVNIVGTVPNKVYQVTNKQ